MFWSKSGSQGSVYPVCWAYTLTLKIFYLATWDPSIALPGSHLTGLRWLTRPVWLISLLRPSNMSNIFVKLFAQQCCVASWDCFLHILTPFCLTNLLFLLFATWKFVMRRGDNTCNKQSQLATQHCCEEGCTKMLPVLLDLKRPMSQTGLLCKKQKTKNKQIM